MTFSGVRCDRCSRISFTSNKYCTHGLLEVSFGRSGIKTNCALLILLLMEHVRWLLERSGNGATICACRSRTDNESCERGQHHAAPKLSLPPCPSAEDSRKEEAGDRRVSALIPSSGSSVLHLR